MAFNQNGSLPVSAVNSLSTKAAAPVIFTLTTDGKDLTQLFTTNGGNFAAGTIISIACNASRTAYIKAYNTSDVLYLTQDTSSGTALMTLSSETKRIWARVDSTTDVTFTVQPSKTVPTKILDIIRSSTTYTQGTDYTLGEKAHIIGVGSGGGGGVVVPQRSQRNLLALEHLGQTRGRSRGSGVQGLQTVPPDV